MKQVDKNYFRIIEASIILLCPSKTSAIAEKIESFRKMDVTGVFTDFVLPK
jgi:hypothetical protein